MLGEALNCAAKVNEAGFRSGWRWWWQGWRGGGWGLERSTCDLSNNSTSQIG